MSALIVLCIITYEHFLSSLLDRELLEPRSFPSCVCSFWKGLGCYMVAKYFLNELTRKTQLPQD